MPRTLPLILTLTLTLISASAVADDLDQDIKALQQRAEVLQKKMLENFSPEKMQELTRLRQEAVESGEVPDLLEFQGDPASHEALRKTMDLLNDPAARNQMIQEDQSGHSRAVEERIKQISGGNPAVREGIYGLASDIFKDMVRNANGDPAQMLKVVEDAKRDPASFGKSLSPEQMKKLKGIAGQVEKNTPKPH